MQLTSYLCRRHLAWMSIQPMLTTDILTCQSDVPHEVDLRDIVNGRVKNWIDVHAHGEHGECNCPDVPIERRFR